MNLKSNNMKSQRHSNRIFKFVGLAVILLASEALAKRAFSSDTPFLLRFLKAAFFATLWYGIQFGILRLFFWKFFKEKMWRWEKYIICGVLCASLVSSLDSWNDEAWFPGMGIGIMSSFSMSFFVFHVMKNWQFSLAVISGIVLFVLTVLPLMMAAILFQNVILCNFVNVSW